MHSLIYPSILLTLSVVASGVSGAALHHVHHVHRQTSLTCFEDNALRTLERFSSDAAAFCPKFLTAPSEKVPSNLAGLPASRLSSACACFQKTAAPANPASTPATSPTSAPVVTPTPAPVSSSKVSSLSVPSSTTLASAIVPTTISTSALANSVSSTSSLPIVGPIKVPTSGKVYTGGKRGLVYDYHSKDYSKFFKDSNKIAFGSDWNLKRSPAPGVNFEQGAFIPTIRVDGGLKNDDWKAGVQSLISSGTPMIFASNEPDNNHQANLSPSQAATVYKNYIQPFAGQVSLASPAITNGGGATGLGFLENFVAQCADCHFDIINVHHYVSRREVNVAQAVSAVKSFLSKDVPAFKSRHSQFQNAKICLGEFWLWEASDDEGADYLRALLPWLDGNNDVACYQAFGGLWEGNFINSAGTGLSKSGQVYHDL
ncbi:MAG: hypothetical protein L6R40_004766 [Gallowayella cf. fulva]|nr:MAG: hypothetical protein L6R40_004766 [Xanthomendoza cf. fulva]